MSRSTAAVLSINRNAACIQMELWALRQAFGLYITSSSNLQRWCDRKLCGWGWRSNNFRKTSQINIIQKY